MRFTLKQLRYFDAALRCGSIAKAAKEMSISQSSITAAIDMIEQTIGVDLFRRIPAKGIVPTRTGEQVGRKVALFLEEARRFESDIMSVSGVPTGTLRLACYAPTAPHILPPLLKRIAQSHPDIRIELLEGDLRAIAEMIQSGAVDVALTYRRETPERLSFAPLFRARPWALVPDNWPQARQDEVTFEDLAALPMVIFDQPATQDYFKGMFKSKGLSPNVVHSTKSSSVLRGLVAAHFGYSILNICGAADRDGRAGYVALPIAGTVDEPLYGVAFSPAVQNAAIVRAVIDTGQSLARQGGFDHLRLSADQAPNHSE